MRIHVLLATAIFVATAIDLPGQGRGRRGSRIRPPEETTPAPAAAEAKPDDKPKEYTAIVGGDVYLGTGQRLSGATVLIADDKIAEVGHNLTLPEGTRTIDAKGKVVSPGFVCVTASGMGASRSAPFKDGCNPFDPSIKQGLAAGITSFLTGSPGGGNMPSGTNAIAKLAYGDVDGMVMQENTVAGINVPMNLEEFAKLKESIEKAREYVTALAEFPAKKAADKDAKEPPMPRGAEKIVDILRDKVVLWVTLRSAGFNPFRAMMGLGNDSGNDLDAIRQALEISKLLDHGVVLQKPMSAWLVPDEIAATGSMVVLSPRDRTAADPKDPDRTGSNLASAAILDAVGVPVAVTCPQGRFGGGGVGTNGILGQDLNTPHVDAAFAVRGGLDNRKALRTLTLDAARTLGVESRIGSLEAGKDADVLILDGDPLHYATFVEVALVNGKVVYEKDKDPLYSHITR
ncbi:MAG: amidohydrolase family protein [Planctomycetes bacterium]|nr:amidohydrolase family protein [Planctomycetota bacterium]